MSEKIQFIEGRRLLLRPLLDSDFNDQYLAWLNDPEVNRYSQRRPRPCTPDQMKSYVDYFGKYPERGFVLAIVVKNNNLHIGNISLESIHPVNRCADIAIFIGDKSYWNQNYGGEAIYLVARHAFCEMNLHKLIVGSFNPAFVRCIEKLGWRTEGRFTERIWSDNRYHDQVWQSKLAREFTVIEEFEKD